MLVDLFFDGGFLLGKEYGDKEALLKDVYDAFLATEAVLAESALEGSLNRWAEGCAEEFASSVALIHGTTYAVEYPQIVVATIKDGLDLGAGDGSPSKLVLVYASPEKDKAEYEAHVEALRTILDDEIFVEDLVASKTQEDFSKLFGLKDVRTASDFKDLDTSILSADGIFIHESIGEPHAAIEKMVQDMVEAEAVIAETAFRGTVWNWIFEEIEKLPSQAVLVQGQGWPVKEPRVSILTLEEPIVFREGEENLLRMIILVALPLEVDQEVKETAASLVKITRDVDFIQELVEIKDKEELLEEVLNRL